MCLIHWLKNQLVKLPKNKVNNPEVCPRGRVALRRDGFDESVLSQRMIFSREGHDAQQVPDDVVGRVQGQGLARARFAFPEKIG